MEKLKSWSLEVCGRIIGVKEQGKEGKGKATFSRMQGKGWKERRYCKERHDIQKEVKKNGCKEMSKEPTSQQEKKESTFVRVQELLFVGVEKKPFSVRSN